MCHLVRCARKRDLLPVGLPPQGTDGMLYGINDTLAVHTISTLCLAHFVVVTAGILMIRQRLSHVVAHLPVQPLGPLPNNRMGVVNVP